MTAEQLLKHRYKNRFGDKWDRVAKQFDYYDMIDFAEAYTKSQFPTVEELFEKISKDLYQFYIPPYPRINLAIEILKLLRNKK